MNQFRRLRNFVAKLRGSSIIEDLGRYEDLVQQIIRTNMLCGGKSEEELQTQVNALRNASRQGELSAEKSIDVYAIVMEAVKRKLNVIPHNVQVLAALALRDNTIIEMQTGEGKTLAAVFAACFHGLSHNRVHILTFNDYLAQRDAEWMRPVYEFLGLSVGCIQQGQSKQEKQAAYNCDITYATAREVGFDFLRSSMAYEKDEVILSDFSHAIVDEADAILIDEARNPLVIAGNIDSTSFDLYKIAAFAAELKHEVDYSLDEYARNVFLTDKGIAKVEHNFNVDNLYDEHCSQLNCLINLALQASALLHKDVDYIVKDDTIKLIDEFTGRVLDDRRWQNGLQSAVEAKEKIPIQSEGQILNTISIPDLLRHYRHVSGMTGTARHSCEEFKDIYGLSVTIIPPNIPSKRIDHPDRIFSHKAAKLKAVVNDVKEKHSCGRPVLVGTLTVKESEELQQIFIENDIMCTVLNAKNDQTESRIIADAGMKGKVTIATNMAGRGCDIKLGGAKGEDKEKILSAGGLHIIGTNRHESVRIDNQLKGRSGRQGDAGSSQFFVAMDDPLMIKYGLKSLLPKKLSDLQQEKPLTHRVLSKSIAQSQRIIEGHLHEIRKDLYNYSSLLEKQRSIYFDKRKHVLFSMSSNSDDDHRHRLLFQCDYLWSLYLAEVMSIKEAIYWERYAGKDPFSEFCKRSDKLFRDLMTKCETIGDLPAGMVCKRPASTWTYVINDNPFKNQLAMRLIQLGSYRF